MGDNPFLRHQSLTILQQIEELKNWHRQQQSKENSDIGTNKGIDKNNTKLDHYEGVENVNKTLHHKNTGMALKPLTNFDEIPIKVTTTNFIDIVENNVPPNETESKNQSSSKPKFKFLKRGEGIARFRMGPRKINKNMSVNNSERNPTLKLTADSKISNNNTEYQAAIHNNRIDQENIEKKENIAALDPPDLKLDFKHWKSIFSSGKADEIIEKAIDNNQLEIFQPNSSLDSSTASIMGKVLAAGRKHIKEREELRVFEAMEQHVQNTSFNSSSSYVAKLMENAVISTPEKRPVLNQHFSLNTKRQNQLPTIILENDKQNVRVQMAGEQKSSVTSTWTNQDSQQDYNKELSSAVDNNEFQQSLHVRFSEDIDFKSFVECSQSIDSTIQKEPSRSIEFNDSEEWKDNSEEESTCCSQCSTSYSSSEEDARAISPPIQPPTFVQNSQSDHTKHRRNLQKKKKKSPQGKMHVDDLKTDNTTEPDSISCAKDNLGVIPPILSEKLTELENEIEIFRAENNKLKSIREKLEKEHKQFLLEKRKFIKDMDEEKKKEAAHIEEERQKLAKDKFIFEKHSKALLKNPTKEERKEIQALREQLTEMKEELNKKESRWGAAQARVRNQVKLLEEDNKKLKGEIEALTKKSKQFEFLTQNKKGRAFNNTKLIHAINNHLSALPSECENGTAMAKSTNGYFKSKSSSVKTVDIDEVNPKNCTIKVIDNNPKSNNINNEIDCTKSSSCLPPEENAKADGLCETSPTLIQGLNNIESNAMHQTVQPKHMKYPESKPDTEKSPRELYENQSLNAIRETLNESGSVETLYPDGKKEIRYKNGNVKKVDPLTGTEKTIYFNGDVKETTSDGTVKYYFSESRIWHTTLSDGLEVFDFPNGQVEKRHNDGLVEIVYPNQCKKLNYPDGSEIIYYPDGTTLKTEADKKKILSLPNGQKEIHTDECIRREYPDGTLKIVYADGTTETVYSNGRVRLKDKYGNLVMDSATSPNCRLPL